MEKYNKILKRIQSNEHEQNKKKHSSKIVN